VLYSGTRFYRIKKVSDIAGVSVRTLHHYDHIDLLKPARVDEAGYRLYSDANLARLQEILFFKELGFGLSEIREILDRPGYDRRDALLTHKQILREKNLRITRLIKTVDKTLDSMNGGSVMGNDEMFGAFDEATIEEYKEEARERWGGTKAYKESERRTAKYTKADWARIQAESDDIHNRLAEIMAAGKSPSDSEAQELVGLWFKHIDKYFYPCTPEIFKGLGEMYVADPRFKKVYEDIKPGLAEFMKNAMTVYADNYRPV
jgi:DNA-binding transcriptional MerR regulator